MAAGLGALALPGVIVVPVAQQTAGSMPQYDLKNVPRDRSKLYTLQIGFYDTEFGDDFRQAAEKAAAALREEGEEAYYFHGPQRSSFTIGAFGKDAATINESTGEPVYSAQVQALQQKYPYNLANGRTLNERRGGVVTPQPSFLVEIPND